MVMWLGADWDSKKCVVVFERRGRQRKRHVGRSPEVVKRFVEWLDADEQLVVGIEDGDRLWPRLWAQAGAEVYVFDGKKSRRFSESLTSSGARDDSRSARDLRSMVMSSEHRCAANRVDLVAAGGLGVLHRAVDVASREVNRKESRLRSLLRQFHPAVAELVSNKLKSAYVLNALEQAPTASAWETLGTIGRGAVMRTFSTPKRAKLAAAFGDDWGAVDADEEEAVRFVLRGEVKAVRAALERKRETELRLASGLEQDPVGQSVLQVKGVGTFIGAALVVASAESDASQGRDAIAVKMGTAPVTARSGERGDARPTVFMRRSADGGLRKASHLMGLQLVQRHAWAKAQYEYYRGRGLGAAAAFRRIVRSFSRILNALLRDGTEFDETRYIRQLQKRGIVWAMRRAGRERLLDALGLAPRGEHTEGRPICPDSGGSPRPLRVLLCTVDQIASDEFLVDWDKLGHGALLTSEKVHFSAPRLLRLQSR